MILWDVAETLLASKTSRKVLQRLDKSPRARKLLNRLSRPRGIFDSFEEAWRSATHEHYAGHDHPDAVKIHLNLSHSLRPSDYAALYWLSRIDTSGPLRVFDYGGNVGNVYYTYAKHLSAQGRDVEWTVFDLPKNTQQGRELAAARDETALQFTDSVTGVDRGTVLLSSGAYHYWEKSAAEFLDQFSELPEHILVNRTPTISKQPGFITVQQTETYAVPCLVRNAEDLIAEFEGCGYVLVDRWKALELSVKMPMYPHRAVHGYSGFYFRRSAPASDADRAGPTPSAQKTKEGTEPSRSAGTPTR